MSEDGTTPTADSTAATAAATTAATTGTPPGWYADPQGAMRWWDGAAWTAHVHAGSGSAVTRTATILSTAAPAEPSRTVRRPQLPALPQLGRRTWIVVGAVVGVLVLLAGYLLFGRGVGDAGQDAGTVAHTLSPQQVVRQVVLTDADLKGGLHATLIKGGDQVKGQVTFDLCGYRYTSEAHRVARRQVGIVDAKRQFTGASNEVVVYDSAASAAKALAELRTAFAHCPHTYVRDATAPHPMLLYSAVKSRSATGAQVPHPGERIDEVLLATWTAHQRTPAETGYEMVAVVRYESVVSVVWFVSPTPVTASTAHIVSALSDLTARKIPAS